MKHTHRGHCQICAHLQAVDVQKGTIAKHGYEVAGFGYFFGTCRASDKPPMERDRTITDATIKALHKFSTEQSKFAEDYRSGKLLPEQVVVGWVGRNDVVAPFAQGTAEQQRVAVHASVTMHEREARGALSHAKMLTELVAKIHGAALQPVAKPARVKLAPPKVDVTTATVTGTFATAAARKAELDKINRAYDKAVDQLQAFYLNIPHSQRTKEGEEVYYAPHYPHLWKPRHSAAALAVFPAAASVVAEIEQLVKARNAVKNA